MFVLPAFEKIASYQYLGLERTVEKAKATDDFTGKKGDELLLYPGSTASLHRELFLGLGNSRVDLETLRTAGGKAVKKAMANKNINCLVIALPNRLSLKQKLALIEGACLANHVFDCFKSKPEKKEKGPG